MCVGKSNLDVLLDMMDVAVYLTLTGDLLRGVVVELFL